MKVDVSIVVPIYNSEETLKKCLDSILKQKYTNFEVILINDGSSDESLNICRDYSNNYENIIIIDKKNEGSSVARNKGIDRASGRYIMFIDSDDWIEDTMIKDKYELAMKYNTDMVISGIKVDYMKKNESVKTIINNYKFSFWKNIDEISSNIINIFENALINSSCNKLYKTSILKENNIYFQRTEVGEDTLFNLSVLEKINSLLITDKSYYHYNKFDNKETLTGKIIDESYKKYIYIHEEMLRLFEKWGRLNDEVVKYINRTMISQYLAVTYKIMRSKEIPYNEKKKMLDSGYKNEIIQNTFKNVNANTWFEAKFRLLIRKRKYYIAMKLLKFIDIKKSIRK